MLFELDEFNVGDKTFSNPRITDDFGRVHINPICITDYDISERRGNIAIFKDGIKTNHIPSGSYVTFTIMNRRTNLIAFDVNTKEVFVPLRISTYYYRSNKFFKNSGSDAIVLNSYCYVYPNYIVDYDDCIKFINTYTPIQNITEQIEAFIVKKMNEVNAKNRVPDFIKKITTISSIKSRMHNDNADTNEQRVCYSMYKKRIIKLLDEINSL